MAKFVWPRIERLLKRTAAEASSDVRARRLAEVDDRGARHGRLDRRRRGRAPERVEDPARAAAAEGVLEGGDEVLVLVEAERRVGAALGRALEPGGAPPGRDHAAGAEQLGSLNGDEARRSRSRRARARPRRRGAAPARRAAASRRGRRCRARRRAPGRRPPALRWRSSRRPARARRSRPATSVPASRRRARRPFRPRCARRPRSRGRRAAPGGRSQGCRARPTGRSG